MDSERVTIVGTGQLGLVLADAAAARGATVRLLGRDETVCEELSSTRRNDRRLPGFQLPRSVLVTPDPAIALAGASLIFSAVPTAWVRATWERLRAHVPPRVAIVSATKGLESGTMLRPSLVLLDAIGESANSMRPVAVLTGPAIAAELALHLPATLVAATSDLDLALRVQEALKAPWLRIYRHDDICGAEIAGAAKNVIAIAAGIVDGLGLGVNAKSALLTRGLAEITRLGVALGARAETFFGAAGVGDLATTCFAREGRNRTCGERLARGESLDAILSSTPSIIEGIPAAKAIVSLALIHAVDMPITEAVERILAGAMAPADAIARLMQRESKAERIG